MFVRRKRRGIRPSEIQKKKINDNCAKDKVQDNSAQRLGHRSENMDLEPLAELASAAGYEGICMLASQVGVQSSVDEQVNAARILAGKNLAVSMVTGNFSAVYNNERGPDCLRNITPYDDNQAKPSPASAS